MHKSKRVLKPQKLTNMLTVLFHCLSKSFHDESQAIQHSDFFVDFSNFLLTQTWLGAWHMGYHE